MIQDLFREVASLSLSLLALTAITLVCLYLAARTVAKREYVLEQ